MLLSISKVILTTSWRSDYSHFKSYLSRYIAALITSSVDKIILFVAKMTFKVVVIGGFFSGQDHFCSDRNHFLEADIRLLVAKITFVATEITFIVAVITSAVAKITFVEAENFFKVAVITSLVAKITFVVAKIFLSGCTLI